MFGKRGLSVFENGQRIANVIFPKELSKKAVSEEISHARLFVSFLNTAPREFRGGLILSLCDFMENMKYDQVLNRRNFLKEFSWFQQLNLGI